MAIEFTTHQGKNVYGYLVEKYRFTKIDTQPTLVLTMNYTLIKPAIVEQTFKLSGLKKISSRGNSVVILCEEVEMG